MGTTSTSAASTTAPQYFTGVSTYSADFQQIIQRAVAIAQLPVTELTDAQTADTNKVQELQTLNPDVAALGADVTTLGALASSGGLAASSSDSSTVSVINIGAAAAATYTISDISSLASAASETSLAGYSSTQAINTSGLVNLVVGSNTYQLNLTGAGLNNISGLASAINNANAGVNATILTAGSNDYLVVSASNAGATTLQLNGVTPADLISRGGTGTETSLQTYTDATSAAVSATGQLQLVVGSNTYSINLAAGNNNLNGLAQAINGAGAGITATVTGSSGAYSLSLTSSGSTAIQLNDLQSPSNLISGTNQGSNAQFNVNGEPVTQSSNTITSVIPGISFTLQNTTTGSVTLSLASSASSLSDALQSLVTDYNTLATAVTSQEGTSTGPLVGDPIINQISQDMQQLVTYWNPASTSSIRSLSDLGVTFNDTTGQLSFDSTALSALSSAQVTDAFTFLGSSGTGFAALASNFTQLTDPISGTIQSEETGYTADSTQLGNQITTLNAHVAQIQATATASAQQADAYVAELQSEQTVVDASVESLNYVLYGRQTNANGL